MAGAVAVTPPAARAAVDPVTVEMIRNALPAISDEMSWDLERTSYNAMIYDVKDYTCAVLEADGSLLAQYVAGCSHFVADIGAVIKDGIATYGAGGFAPGDVILHNHQRVHGQHLNNVCVYTPCFVDGTLVAFPVVNAHWVDVGGNSTGGGGAAVYDPWGEGMQFDQIKIYERGEPDCKMLKHIRGNIRFADAAMGDLRSQVAACRLAERRIQELVRKYGLVTFRAAVAAIYDETEAKARAAVARIPDGTYEAETFFQDRRAGFEPYRLHAKVTVAGGDMTIDLSGCSPERPMGYNSRSHAGAYIPYKAFTAPLDPVNEGSFRALRTVIPEGSMFMARYPMSMALWSPAIVQMVDTVCLALAPALPDRVAAGHHATLGGAGLSLFGRDPRTGRQFLIQSKQVSGGWGGSAQGDGQDCVIGMCQGDVRCTPIEADELKAPVLILERSLRQDSGGAGKFRGGLGSVFRARSLAEARWPGGGGGDRPQGCRTWGLAGGKPGMLPEELMKLPDQAEFTRKTGGSRIHPAGTEVLAKVAGGGGWGDPLEREPARVLEDVIEGYVSARSAREDYGVVLTGDGRAIDDAATIALRASRRTAPD